MKLYINNMVCRRCKIVVQKELEKLGIHCNAVELGQVDVVEAISVVQLGEIEKVLLRSGFALVNDKKRILVQKIKGVVIEMVHYADEPLRMNFSDFLSQKLDYNYTYLANIFSDLQGISIERFIITHKIERVKELLVYDELTITEIADRLHYSSVAHLSAQFKKVTGLPASRFKKLNIRTRCNLENL